MAFDVLDVPPQSFNLLLHVDDRNIGNDAERRIEKTANVEFAVFARLCPQRRNDELVPTRQLPRLRALFGCFLQDRIDRLHQPARLFVCLLPRAWVLWLRRWRPRNILGPRRRSGRGLGNLGAVGRVVDEFGDDVAM